MEARYLTDEEGARVGVVLSIEDYERLIEAAEELEDIRDAQEAHRQLATGEDESIPWEKVREHVGADYGNPESD